MPISTLARPRRRRATLAGVVLSLLALVPSRPVHAQQVDPTEPAVVQSWAVTPTTADPDDASSRPFLDYTLDPGATAEDSVTLWNFSNVQLTFRIYGSDARNAPDGSFDVLPGAEKPKDVGRWITLPQEHYTLSANTKLVVPVTIKVPADARPGDHAGAILASNQAQGTGPDGRAVSLDRRTGTRVYVRVGGPLNPELAVVRSKLVYHGSADPRQGTAALEYTVRNVGNVRMGATQKVELVNVLGRRIERVAPPPVAELLPGGEAKVIHRFDEVTAAVRLSARITLTPQATNDGDELGQAATSRTATTWAFPWLLVGLAVVIAASIRGIRALRRRRKRTPPAATDPSETREPVSVR